MSLKLRHNEKFSPSRYCDSLTARVYLFVALIVFVLLANNMLSKVLCYMHVTPVYVTKRYLNMKATDAQITVLFLDWLPMVTSAQSNRKANK